MTHLAPEVRTALITVFAIFAVGNLVPIAIRRWQLVVDLQKLTFRLRTWWLIVTLIGLSLAWSIPATIVFLGFVSYLALKEFFSMTPTRKADRRVLFYAYLAVVIQYILAGNGWYGTFMVFIPVIMFAWLPTRMWLIGKTEGFLRAAGTLHWGLMVTVYCLSHTAILLVFHVGETPRIAPQFPSPLGQSFPGPGLFVLLLLLTELNDFFHELWGNAVGFRKVSPTVSPRKTYGGLIGGTLSTMLVAVIVGPWLTLLDTPRALLAGLLIAVAGFAGDLCMSALKRDLKIQNFGATLPGHGGVLDRVDSLVFTAPLFFHFIRYSYGS